MSEGDKTNLVNQTADGADPNVDGSASPSDNKPPLSWQRQLSTGKCPPPRGMTLIVLVSVIFSAAITIALILTIIFGEPQVEKLGAVAADTTEASQCGLEMLTAGGSAVDAAVAAALCGAVIQYPSTGLGGGGLMLIHNHRTDKTTLLDFLPSAPGNATSDMFAGDGAAALTTALGTGVPGFMRGLEEAHNRFGRMKWFDLFAPAIRLATDGFRVSADLNRLVASNAARLGRNALLKRWYLTDAGLAKPVGALIAMPELASALTTLRDKGAQAMYTGKLAEEFLATVGANGGRLTSADLSGYRVLERTPLTGHYRNFTVRTFPPPSAGGAYTLLVAQVLAGYPQVGSSPTNATSLLYHRAAEAMKLGLGAVQPLGEAAPSGAVAMEIASAPFADKIRGQIQDSRVLNADSSLAYSKSPWPPAGSPASSHLVAVDNEELYVSMDTSVNSPFATLLTTGTGGILLNNALANFAPNSAGANHSNAPASGRRPATLMGPAFAFNPRQRCGLRVAFGASNITSVPGTAAWLLSRLSDLSSDTSVCPRSVTSRRRESSRHPCLPAKAAIATPRLNPELPSAPAKPQLEIENGLTAEVTAFLAHVGHRLASRPDGLGRAQIIAMDMYSMVAQSDSSRSGAKAATLPQK